MNTGLKSAQRRVELAFQEYGQGDPVLILHGLLGSGDNWRSISQRLADRFQVFAIDLRNHGASPHETLMDFRLMAEDLYHFLHLQSISDVAVIGHSLGGKVAMQFALTRPELVRQLVVVDIGPFEYEPRHKPLLEALQSLDLRQLASRRDADALLAEKVPDTAIRQFLLKNLASDRSGRYHWKMNLNALVKNYSVLNDRIPAGGTYDGPVLFVRGDRSDYLPDDVFQRSRRYFPRASLTTVTGAGHWIHSERPEEFLRVVCEFLTRW